MILKILSPTGIVVNTPIQKIVFEGLNGYQTFLPKHINFLSVLTTGIIQYLDINNHLHYVACNQGIIIKKDDVVSVSVQKVICDDDLSNLTNRIKADFAEVEEERRETAVAMAKLEIGLTRGLMNLKGGQNVSI